MAIYVARCMACKGEALVCGPDAKGFGHGHKPGDPVMIADHSKPNGEKHCTCTVGEFID